jgi:hypothetical protein
MGNFNRTENPEELGTNGKIIFKKKSYGNMV